MRELKTRKTTRLETTEARNQRISAWNQQPSIRGQCAVASRDAELMTSVGES